jgi:hypothetical protein
LTPFDFFFANPTTLYVADEGNATITTTNASGNPVTNLVSDPLAGLQKWVLANNVWQLEYVLQAGLELNEPRRIAGYPVATYTTGVRNITGQVGDLAVRRSVSRRGFRARALRFMAPLKHRMEQPRGA